MRIEAVLLTGGRSSRMGTDKASMPVGGEAVSHRTARLLQGEVSRVTVLGAHEVPGCEGHPDHDPYQGPLWALAEFGPTEDCVFVCSCDLPRFDPRIVACLAERIERHESIMAILPFVDGSPQPLCALYRASAFAMIQTVRAEGQRSVMSWIDTLWVEYVTEGELRLAGLDPQDLLSADTAEEWERALKGKAL